MINYLWSIIVCASLMFSFVSGKASAMTSAVFSSVSKAVDISITLLGIICFWSGIMETAKTSGFTKIVSGLLSPITKFLFPSLKKESAALSAITMNITANLFGLGNAATPFGLMAVKELERENGFSKRASDAMCMFVIINTASLQLLPTTIMGLRAKFGSAAPSEIIIPVWITSVLSLLIGVISAKISERRF